MSSDILWQWSELCDALGLPRSEGPDVSGISIDTRTLVPGDLFVALKGDPGPRFHTAQRSNRDGHDFIDAAVAAGAAGVLIDRAIGRGVPALRVADTLDGLWQLGMAARRRFRGQVVAVTGSSGKTTAKSFLSAALGCPASAGSLNNFWGVPLSLARTPPSAAAAVFEIGTNHPGEIAPLAKLVQPDVALVLNVGQAHIEYFEDWHALRREKLSIGDGLAVGGALVVPDDLELEPSPDRARRVVRFGADRGADVQLVDFDVRRQRAHYRIGRDGYGAHVPGGGRHRALTLGAALACLDAAGLATGAALELPDDLVPAGRGNRHRVGGRTLIDDSYNANPASMAAALEGLTTELPPRYALIGEMLELGPQAAALHAALAPHCAGIEGVICVGRGARALFDALPASGRLAYFENVDEIDIGALDAMIPSRATVLVKGSNRVFWAKAFVRRLLDAWG